MQQYLSIKQIVIFLTNYSRLTFRQTVNVICIICINSKIDLIDIIDTVSSRRSVEMFYSD